MTRKQPEREPLTPRLLKYEAADLGMRETVALFRDLVAVPFDVWALLPQHYAHDRDVLARLGHITLRPRSNR